MLNLIWDTTEDRAVPDQANREPAATCLRPSSPRNKVYFRVACSRGFYNATGSVMLGHSDSFLCESALSALEMSTTSQLVWLSG